MRLKFLFFPIMLIASISIFVGYIWPEIQNLKTANTENINNQLALKAINDKKAAVEQIDGQINNDIDGETMINNYLPSDKVEERILTGVNFLANDSGVSLVNIALVDDVADDSSDIAFSSPFSTAKEAKDAKDTVAKVSQKSSLQGTKTSISISGEYSKIRLFLDQLQRLPIYNSIESLEISSQVAEKKDAESGEVTTTNNLAANIVVDFGYMNLAKMDNKKISTFKPEIDNSISLAVKQYISQKAPAVDSSGDKSGKNNPFLP